ncbi:MAG: metallophosphoesterase [Phycisphaerae bacterium]|nr:metallophosphoesterase [Phycisphaerae bacterium]MDD5381017.1 metallophosphoesterase [Phycisphaerae bacterium]
MPQTIIDLLNSGIEACNADRFRRGNLIHLPSDVQLIATGDIHGHRRNFERIVAFADLANNPDRHVLLQEIIHGGPTDAQGGCLSHKLLFDVIRYKLKFPDRVHIIMGNHDIAFINNSKVMKDGLEMNRAMRLALEREFQQAGDDIKLAIRQFLFSQPLAVRTENRIWLSHSLPADRFVDKFDRQILDRPLKINDCVKPGSAYLLTWGRNFSLQTLDKMAELFDVDIFILGHQPQQQGWSRAGKNIIILASDHNHGCLLPVDLAQSYTIETLADSIVPLASIS